MRLHRNLVYTTIDDDAIFNEGEYADKVVARSLKDKRWEVLTENLLPKPSIEVDGKIIHEMPK
jgi:hypothetical protein